MYFNVTYRIHCKTGGMVNSLLDRLDPKEYLLCDGRALRKQDYPELYAVIGDIYGSPGSDEFRLPDLRSGVLCPPTANSVPEEYVEIDGNEWTMRELERVTTPDGWD